MSLAGRVIVITGASSGIGAQLAKHCVVCGAKVVLAARRKHLIAELSETLGGKLVALAVPCDVTIREHHQNLMLEALEAFGKIDCWVNNAGVGISKPAISLTEEDVDVMMLINFKSVLYAMQAIIPYFKEVKRGQIINVSSLLGRLPMNSFRAMYSASKAALNSLTCNMRLDLINEGYHDIKVNLFIPGIVQTDFGIHAIGGGPDSRTLPGAQPVEEVADCIVQMMINPKPEVYSRQAYKNVVGAYYSADDISEIESRPPFRTNP